MLFYSILKCHCHRIRLYNMFCFIWILIFLQMLTMLTFYVLTPILYSIFLALHFLPPLLTFSSNQYHIVAFFLVCRLSLIIWPALIKSTIAGTNTHSYLSYIFSFSLLLQVQSSLMMPSWLKVI